MADLTVTAANVSPTNDKQFARRPYLAAATITAGQAVYLNTSGKVNLARANAAGTTRMRGIALQSAVLNAPVDVMWQGPVYGFDLSGLAYGASVWLSAATAGALTDTAPSTTGQYVVPAGRVDCVTEAGSTPTKVLMLDINQSATYTVLP
jgi:hypothetical protein